jgi:predicted acetylornithine/succinylornithine family transaminase
MTEKHNEVIKLFDKYVIPCYTRKPIVLVRGKGTRVWDAGGKVYLDFIAGIAVLNLGHSHPAIVEAINRQAGLLTHVSNLYYNENQGQLAMKLSEISLQGKCFFCNSGAEANEALIKLARLWGHEQKRYEVITMKNSFHGRTLATLTATGQNKIQKGFEPLPEGFVLADFNNLESVKSAITEKTAAVLVEPVQGEGGVIPAEKEFLKGLRDLCDEKKILLMFDEVQCGMGRTGQWFAYQHYDVIPDAISIAKALAAGLPMGAIVTSPKLADVLQAGKHASTFGGSPFVSAVALAAIKVIEDEGLLKNAAEMGEKFKAGLKLLADKYEHLKEVRGMGLMIGLVLDKPAKELEARLMEIGLLSLATADNVIRFLPPLNVKQTEIEEALEIIDDVCAEWHGIPPAEEPAAEPAEQESAPAVSSPAETQEPQQ